MRLVSLEVELVSPEKAVRQSYRGAGWVKAPRSLVSAYRVSCLRSPGSTFPKYTTPKASEISEVWEELRKLGGNMQRSFRKGVCLRSGDCYW